jgi:hypothetical protein
VAAAVEEEDDGKRSEAQSIIRDMGGEASSAGWARAWALAERFGILGQRRETANRLGIRALYVNLSRLDPDLLGRYDTIDSSSVIRGRDIDSAESKTPSSSGVAQRSQREWSSIDTTRTWWECPDTAQEQRKLSRLRGVGGKWKSRRIDGRRRGG